MLLMDRNVGGRKEEVAEEEEEEGGVTGLILQPLDDDLRSGRGIERDPSPATEKWQKKEKKQKLCRVTVRTDQFSRTLQQFIFCDFLYGQKKKKKKEKRSVSEEEETVARNSGELCVMTIRLCGVLPLKTGGGGRG